MAGLHVDEGERESRPRKQRRHSSPPPGGDWADGEDQPSNLTPRTRHWDEIHRPAPGRPAVAHRRPPPSRSSLSSTSTRVPPSAAMPLLLRSSTLPHTRSSKAAYVHDDDRSRSDSRRTGSYRDLSPRSMHRHRSTPDSRRSSKTSVSGSDEETEITVETQEGRPDYGPDKEALRERINIRRRDRRHRRHNEPALHDEDLDDERGLRRRHTLDDRESPSRYAPDRHDDHHHHDHHHHHHKSRRSQQKIVTVEEDRRHRSSSKRSSKRYYESEAPVVHVDKPASLRRSNTTTGSQVTSSQSVSSSRRSSLLGSFLGISPHAHATAEKPGRLVECVVCMDDLPSTKTAKLKCGHRMCNSCLRRSFKLSITDPQHMPPKCCSTDHIPLKHVDRLLDTTFKKTWNRKYHEFSTRNRIYCPSRRCGEWIKPENIYREDSRKVAKCGRCRTKVCVSCNGKWHASRDCPRDDETNKFLEQAKQEGWQRCHRCKAMVELKEGCNHMTCRCGAEFCMICGAKWKTCECPWFNFDAVENDRLEHMQIPADIRADRLDNPGQPPPRDFRAGGLGQGHGVRPRPQNYEEEMLVRRLQEQRDEDLARRLQTFGSFDDDGYNYSGRFGDAAGMGNHAGHFRNDDYRRRPENVMSPQAPPPPPTQPSAAAATGAPSFERSSTGGDYVSGVNRARGVPGSSSMERRLADRFNTDHRTSPTHRPTAPPPPAGAGMNMPGMHPPMMPMMSPMGPRAHAPPPAVPTGAPLLRRHTMEEERYNTSRSTRSSERVVPGRLRHSYEAEAAVHAPTSRRHRRDEPPKSSMLAGLTGQGRGMNRVFEWRDHVEPGVPDEEAATAQA